MDKKTQGYILAAFSAATYGMNPLFSLPLYADGMGVDSVLFFRYLFAVPMVALMVKSRGRSFAIGKGELLPLLMVGLFFVHKNILYVYIFIYILYIEVMVAKDIVAKFGGFDNSFDIF